VRRRPPSPLPPLPRPAGELLLRNRHRARRVDLRRLRELALDVLAAQPGLQTFELGVQLVAADEMAAVNETFLDHAGSTDVITFDYAARPTPSPSQEGNGAADVPAVSRESARPQLAHSPPGRGRGWVRRGGQHLHGEIFICVDDAVAQAREFRTSWQSELARYLIHGILHLRGYDDLSAAARRRMKREENRLLRWIARQHPLSRLARRSKLAR